MSAKINFTVDRKSVREGETVMVTWDAGVPDAVTLTIENGYETSRLQLPDSGSRAVMIAKSKGKTTLRLAVAQGGRVERRELCVKVKNIKPIRAKAYRPKSHRNRQFSLKNLPRRIGEWWRTFCSRMRYAWQVMPPKQKRIYRILLIVLAVMWMGSMWRNAGYRAGYEQAIRDAQQIEAEYGAPRGKVVEPNADMNAI